MILHMRGIAVADQFDFGQCRFDRGHVARRQFDRGAIKLSFKIQTNKLIPISAHNLPWVADLIWSDDAARCIAARDAGGEIVDENRSDGKGSLVTGGSKGIGKAIATLLAECGADVGILALEAQDLDETVAGINAGDGGRAIGFCGDVSSDQDVRRAVFQTAEMFGGLHLAVNNAGIAGAPGALHSHDVENWRRGMSINLDGIAFSMMAELQQMLKTGSGSIVNIASVEAHTVLEGFSPYVASKHGVIGLTKGASVDYARHGIRINSVSPGVIETPLTMADGQRDVTERLAERIPLGRLGSPEDVARTVVFILSDHASYMTGTDVVVDGAFLLRA
jgi:NAD(P)-dependent dehydrogenase (short-subunit alcohol dehydrogenase family)